MNNFDLNEKLDKSSQNIEFIWNKMSDKIMRDWHKVGAKMDLAFKDIAKNENVPEESIELKFESISGLI